MADSTRSKSAVKAPERSKPKQDAKLGFPIWLHSGTGQWTKKINDRMFYFGTDQDVA